ncbi:mediator of RNA polymerase II transcription subunit 1-domain-containing protein [Microdochium trichocladiopsis]|uniref:Mediator of RNA polymerase II transcription subunit 1 n=1 Tax=Microdochium trichocladiopsis TaxID=1682393 RepID=A0A9P8Y2R5_9PEZI|nr:mediator of RNA polymerase II transcription subunit 1-domain-containing protein [Microdochium trichocladiopsis]KAH7026122.1 mediator of RNA polymerase II transcription subunit 1-domain-containing protein [Microdochium trichocladiopsis]
MSTPMRHGPSQQGRTPSQHAGTAPTPQASTPFSNSQTQAAFSPRGPRSSPQQFKKSPAAKNSPANMVGHPSNAPVNFDSPSAAAALGALGINDLGLDNISMSGMVTGSGRGSEEEFRKKLDDVIDMLWNAKSALVSNDGLERVATHLGLECMWEDTIGGGEGAKTLVIAGTAFSVEINVNKHIVQEAALAFGEEIPIVDKHVEKASAVLKDDLVLAPGQTPLTKRLRDFWSNLERLRDLDKLSVSPGFNCHEAIAGLYESLHSLHQWDVTKLREIPELSAKPNEQIEVWALAARNGVPQMHVRHRVGLTLDYWMEKYKRAATRIGREDAKTWGIYVSCTPADSIAYNPVRVSDKWIGPSVEKLNPSEEEMMMAAGNPIIDWLEPAPTLLPSNDSTKPQSSMDPAADGMLSGPKTPEVVFMATFEPPVIVTNHAALEIYKFSGTQPQMTTTTFDAWLFPIPKGTMYDPSEPRVIEHTMQVPTFARRLEGQEQDEAEVKSHRNTLHIYKPVYGQVLRAVPFSHPRELVQMLPTLRQYAFLSTLLYRSFAPKHDADTSGAGALRPQQSRANGAGTTTNGTTPTKKSGSTENTTAISDFDSFMSGTQSQPARGGATGTTSGEADRSLLVDITLTAHPVPRLQVVFPFRSETANIQLEIQPGGKVHIISDNVFPTHGIDSTRLGSTGNKARGVLGSLSAAQWAKKLEFTEDIGAWVELIKLSLE